MNKNSSITEQTLLSLGFERCDVSVEESGDNAYYYFIYGMNNNEAFLISCANDECDEDGNYTIEFFDDEDAGYVDDANDLESLIIALKCLKNKK